MRKIQKNRPKIFLLLAAAMLASALCLPTSASAATVLRVGTPAEAEQMKRIAGNDRYETAVQISRYGWILADTAVLCSGNDKNLVDALTAAPLAKAKNAPLLLTEGETLKIATKEELVRLGVKTVYVTSGIGVIQRTVLDELGTMNITVKTLGGYDRFDTAINIAKELNPAPGTLVVATALSNADALSIAAIAAANGFPILLTNPDSFPQSIKVYLDGIRSGVKQTYILGGEQIVSAGLQASLPNAKRLAGADRFATNIAILKEFAGDYAYSKLYLANGTEEHLVDALAGSPLAALTSSGILLTDKSLPEDSAAYAKMYLAHDKVLLGGESALPTTQLVELGATTVWSDDNLTSEAGDTANRLQLADSVQILRKNAIFRNARVVNSLYVHGSNAYLDNVIVRGTIFLDPGQHGIATLNNVKAEKFVVISGDNSQGITLKNVAADTLILATAKPVKINLSDSGQITRTVVSRDAVLNELSGSFGSVRATNISGQEPNTVVELRGNFKEAIQVEEAVTLRAASHSAVSLVEVRNKDTAQQIILDGRFKKVTVHSKGRVDLASQTTIEDLLTYDQATISIPPDASVVRSTDQSKPAQAPGTGSGSVATGSGGTTAVNVNPVTRIEVIDEGGGTVYNGRTLQMKAILTPANASNQKITWSVTYIGGGTGSIEPNTGLLVANEVGSLRVIATNTATGVTGTKDINIVAAYQDIPAEILRGIAATAYGRSDGSITGTTSNMEYKRATDATWLRATGSQITGLAAGTYNVRYAARTGYNAGVPKYVTVPEGRK